MDRIITPERIQAFKEHLIYEEKGAATREKYIRDVRAFYAFVGETSMTKEKALGYKQYLIEHYAPASVNSMLVAINQFLKHMGWHDCVVKRLRIQQQGFRNREQELTKAEYFRLLEAAREKGDTRLFLLMQTLCSTGIRISELRFITIEAIRRGRATVSLKGKTRQVLIPKTLVRELTRYAQSVNIQEGCIFVTRSGKPMDRSNIFHSMRNLYELAGVDRQKIYPHNMRHLFACQYYKVEKDLSRLADLLGHSSINTTRIYTSTSGIEQQRQIDNLGLVI